MSKINIGSLASVIDENGILWMSNVFFNGLFRMALESQEISLVGSFDGVKLSATGLHRGAHINGKEIVFTPFYDQAIRIYHSDCNAFETIIIPDKYKMPFSKSVGIGGHVYFLSKNGFVLDYDSKHHILKEDELSLAYEHFLKRVGTDVTNSMDTKGFLLLQRGGGLLCRLDLVKHQTETICMNGEPENLETGFYDGSLYWFFLNDSQDIISWNRETEKFICYKCEKEEWRKNRTKVVPYAGMLFTENNILISNFNGMFLRRIDKKRQSVETIVKHLKEFRITVPESWGAVYCDMHVVGQDVYFMPCTGNLLLKYNDVTQNMKTIEMAVHREKVPYADEVLKGILKSNFLLEGEGLFSFKDFLGIIQEDIKNETAEDSYAQGKNIMKTICKK